MALPLPAGGPSVVVGKDARAGTPVGLTARDRGTHLHVLGASGSGKSRFLEHLIYQDMATGAGLLLLDPHGTLYQSVLAHVAETGDQFLRRRLVLIDPGDPDYTVGLNPLERPVLHGGVHHLHHHQHHGDQAVDHQVDLVVRAIAKVFGDEDLNTLPRIQRWLPNAIQAVMEARGTLVDLPAFLAPGSAFRRQLIEKLADPYLQSEWAGFEAACRRPGEQEERLEGVLNRVSRFVRSAAARRIFGQVRSTIDLGAAMDSGKVILVNLAPNRASPELSQLLGLFLIDQVVTAAYRRERLPEAKRWPFTVYIDEAYRFLCADIEDALVALRKFRVSFVLAHQTLAQLDADPGLYAAIQGNARTKVVFSLLDPDDALRMARVLAYPTGDQVKYTLTGQKLTPVEETREVVARGTSHGRSQERSESRSRSRSVEASWNQSTTGTQGWSADESESWSDTDADGWSETETESAGTTTGQGVATGRGYAEADSTMRAVGGAKTVTEAAGTSTGWGTGSSTTHGATDHYGMTPEGWGVVRTDSWVTSDTTTDFQGQSAMDAESQTDSWAVGRGHQESHSVQESESAQWQESQSESSASTTSGSTAHTVGGGRSRGVNGSVGATRGQGASAGRSTSKAVSVGASESASETETRSVVPFTAHEIGEEVRSVQFYTPDEELLRVANLLRRLPTGAFLLKVGEQDAVPCWAPFVPDPVPPSRWRLQRLRDQVYRGNNTGRPVAAVEAEVDARLRALSATPTPRPLSPGPKEVDARPTHPRHRRPATSEDLFGVPDDP